MVHVFTQSDKHEVLEDTKKMIPELRNKIKAALDKLKQFLVSWVIEIES
jgi:hypothetical protein